MAIGITDSQHYEDIADAIRAKNGSQSTYTPAQMAGAISAITGGGSANLGTKAITQNGTYSAASDSLDGYSSVTVNVPSGDPIAQGHDVYIGYTDPSPNVGVDGDYYYQDTQGVQAFDETGVVSGNFSSQVNNIYKAGYMFTPNKDIVVKAVRVNRRSGLMSVPTGSVVIAKGDGTVLKQVDNVSFSAGWTEYNLGSNAPTLKANESYIVMVIMDAGSALYQTPSSNITFNDDITFVNGLYGDLPGTTSTNAYSVDIVYRESKMDKATKAYVKASGVWDEIQKDSQWQRTSPSRRAALPST